MDLIAATLVSPVLHAILPITEQKVCVPVGVLAVTHSCSFSDYEVSSRFWGEK